MLRKKILTELGVRKWFAAVGTVCSSGGLAVFGLCHTPMMASMAYSSVALGQGLHHSGFLPNCKPIILLTFCSKSHMFTSSCRSIVVNERIAAICRPIAAVRFSFFVANVRMEPAREALAAKDRERAGEEAKQTKTKTLKAV